MKALAIKPTGVVVELDLEPTDIDRLHELVNGYVELVSVLYNDKPATMFVNEDGIAKNMQPNARATAIYWTATIKGVTGMPFRPLDMGMIYGTAILFEIDKRNIQ